MRKLRPPKNDVVNSIPKRKPNIDYINYKLNFWDRVFIVIILTAVTTLLFEVLVGLVICSTMPIYFNC